MLPIIEIENLTKFYGGTVGVENLTLSVPEGEIFGFLGPNGAGKTTAIRLLMNFIRPDSGSINIFGQRLKWGDYRYLADIGYLPGELSLPGSVTGGALLDYWSGLNGGEPRARGRLLEALSFSKADLKRKVREYSRGMKQKLGVTGALQNLPRLAVLDEPTSGLDPLVRHALLELLKETRREGCAIFFSSHILSEVEQIADSTAIIRRGSLTASSSLEDLKRRRRKEARVVFRNESDIDDFLTKYPCKNRRERRMVSLISKGGIEELISVLSEYEIDDLTITDSSLEEIFLEYYNENG